MKYLLIVLMFLLINCNSPTESEEAQSGKLKVYNMVQTPTGSKLRIAIYVDNNLQSYIGYEETRIFLVPDEGTHQIEAIAGTKWSAGGIFVNKKGQTVSFKATYNGGLTPY